MIHSAPQKKSKCINSPSTIRQALCCGRNSEPLMSLKQRAQQSAYASDVWMTIESVNTTPSVQTTSSFQTPSYEELKRINNFENTTPDSSDSDEECQNRREELHPGTYIFFHDFPGCRCKENGDFPNAWCGYLADEEVEMIRLHDSRNDLGPEDLREYVGRFKCIDASKVYVMMSIAVPGSDRPVKERAKRCANVFFQTDKY